VKRHHFWKVFWSHIPVHYRIWQYFMETPIPNSWGHDPQPSQDWRLCLNLRFGILCGRYCLKIRLKWSLRSLSPINVTLCIFCRLQPWATDALCRQRKKLGQRSWFDKGKTWFISPLFPNHPVWVKMWNGWSSLSIWCKGHACSLFELGLNWTVWIDPS